MDPITEEIMMSHENQKVKLVIRGSMQSPKQNNYASNSGSKVTSDYHYISRNAKKVYTANESHDLSQDEEQRATFSGCTQVILDSKMSIPQNFKLDSIVQQNDLKDYESSCKQIKDGAEPEN